MKKIFASLLFFLFFASISQAQWWVDGGNLLWPYGDVTIKKGLIIGPDTKTSAWMPVSNNDNPVSRNQFYSNQLSYWGANGFFNAAYKYHGNVINPKSRMAGIDNHVAQITDTLFSMMGMQSLIRFDKYSSNSIWGSDYSFLNNYIASLVLGDVPKNATHNSISMFEGYIDEQNVTPAVIDTLNFVYTAIYKARFGSGNQHRYNNFYSFFSDLSPYYTQNKILTGYHFYGLGDYPSYFGGTVIQKIYTTNVSNPPSVAELNAAFPKAQDGETLYIDANNANTNFYQIVKKGTSWWIFLGTKAL